MNVCILSGAPAKASDGVGDFSFALAEELQKEHNVSLLIPDGNNIKANFPIHGLQGGWGFRGCFETLQLIEQLKPHTILVQFVPQLYGLKGANPLFALLLRILKRKGYDVVTVAHEFSSPLGKKLKTTLLGAAHRILLRQIVNASRKIITTTPYCLNLLQQRFLTRKSAFHYIPVSATITPFTVDEEKKAALRSQLEFTSENFVVATFGIMVGEGAVFLKKFLSRLAEDPMSRFLFLGKESQSLKQQFADDLSFQNRIFATGEISEEQISQYLSISNLYAVFYPDGASTRRTSLMAGLAHGIATISNFGTLTNEDLVESQAVYLLNDLCPKELNVLKKHLKDRKWLEDMGNRARIYFEANLSWAGIARDYCHLLNGSTR